MIEQLIQTIQSFIGLNPKEIDFIEKLFKNKSIKKNDFFLAEGQVSKQVGFITKGLMRTTSITMEKIKRMLLHRQTILFATTKVLYPKRHQKKSSMPWKIVNWCKFHLPTCKYFTNPSGKLSASA